MISRRLALVADELKETEIASDLRGRLSARLEEWLSGGGADPLLRERTWGGVVSTNGIENVAAGVSCTLARPSSNPHL